MILKVKKTFLFFIFVMLLFSSCNISEKNLIKDKNEIKEEKKETVLEDFKEEIPLNYIINYKFIDSFEYSYEYFKVKEKFPLQKEKIYLYSFLSLFYYIFSFYSESKELKSLNKINEKINIDDINNLFFEIYLEYKHNFKISNNNIIFDYFFILSFFVKGDYSSFIFRVNANDKLKEKLSEEKIEFLYYLVAFSYLKIYNISKSLENLKEIKREFLANKVKLYIEYFFYNNLINSNLLYEKLENSEYYIKNDGYYLFSLIDPLKKEIFDNVKKFNYLNFYKEVKTKESLPYRVIYFKGYFFVGTFLSGLFVFNQNGELYKYYTPYNSQLISLFIRNFFIYEDKLYIVTYEGINEVIVNNGKVEIRKNLNFPLKLNYNSIYENEDYIACSTHFYGVLLWDKKNKKLQKILDKSICETVFIYGNYLFIGHLQNGLSIYNIKEKKIVKSNIKEAGLDIKSFEVYNNMIFICSYRKGVWILDYNLLKSENKILIKNIIPSNIMDYILKIKIVFDNLYIISINGGILKLNLKNYNLHFVSLFDKIRITDINYNDNIYVISTYEQGVYAFFGNF
ncbi:MAG: hypothetical protein N3A58_01000 [Spirochaetes bacterium]|nr:hypothetical protein [Spirochaetota bacterium]